jgi:formate dehydrogenase major subunit
LLQKFTRVGLKNNNIGSISDLFFGIEQNCLDDMIGFTTSTAKMDDLQKADVIVVVNSNLSEENLVMELKIKAAQKKGAKLVLVNSSEIKLTKYADLWIDSKRGTNTILLNDVLRKLIEANAIDENFASERISNYTAFRKSLLNENKTDTENYSGVEKERIGRLIRMLADKEKNVVFVYNIDSTSDKSLNDLKAIANIILLSGRHGKENNGIIVLREYNNSTGLNEMGANANYLPGFVRTDEKEQIKRIASKWKVSLDEIFMPVDLAAKMKRGEIKAALIFGEDPFANKNSSKFFSNVEFVAVCDAYNTATTAEADVVLPAANYIEQSGSYIRCDNTIQSSAKIVHGLHDYENWQIIAKLARCFGEGFVYSSADEILDEVKTVDRFLVHTEKNTSWLEGYFANGFSKEKFSLADCLVDLSTFDPVKETIHFQENYYFSNIKKKLM